MKNEDVIKLFEFVAQEVDRLNALAKTDWKKAAQEMSFRRGLTFTYDEFPSHYYQCGKLAEEKLYELAEVKLRETPELKGRIKVANFLKPIEVEFAKRALAKQEKITKEMVKEILCEARAWAKSKLEDRIYFFPVYVIDCDGVDDFTFGSTRFCRTKMFFAENEAKLKRSEEDALKNPLAARSGKNADELKKHISNLFNLAKDHFGNYRWVACIEIKEADPDLGLERAREILEASLNLLRLAVHSRRGQFIGQVEDYPELRSASHLSLKLAADEFETWHSSSYAVPHTQAGFLENYRNQIHGIENLELAIEKVRRWEVPDAIEDRLLTALFWFGEAWKETSLLPKIVKFSTCVESLFSSASDHDAITEKISERLAWLSFPEDKDRQERRNTYNKMKAVYAARSKAVHGDNAVKDFNLPLLANDAEEQACLGIFAFIQLPPFFRNKNDKEKLFNEFFVRLKLEGFARAQQVFAEV